MITFVVGEAHQYTVREVLQSRRHPLHGQVLILSYGDFLSFARLPATGYAFLDHERLAPAAAGAIGRRFAALQAAWPGLEALNPPGAFPGRLGVMRRLHEAGINRFRVLPVTEPLDDLRFPVFLRRLDDHEGPLTPLLEDGGSLRREIAALTAAGIPEDLLIVTEYVDTRNAGGAHEKRAYFRIGAHFFPVGLDASRNWVCKGEHDDPDAVVVDDEEVAFLGSDADEAWLRRAFDAAGIGYGRADYAVVDGRPQVFEINTNPLIEMPERAPSERRAAIAVVLDRWMGALAAAFPSTGPEAPRWVAVAGAAPVPTEAPRRRRMVRAVLLAMGRLHWETEVMWRMRALRRGP